MDNELIIRQAEAVDSTVIEALANEIWTQHYTPLIGKKHTEYMLSQFQTSQAVLSDMESGFIYYIAYFDGQPCGYTCIKPADEAFMGKLYLKKELRGKGIGRALFEKVLFVSQDCGARCIRLKCYKHNPSLDIYFKLGFNIVENVISDFGNGCLMDDYVMERRLDEEQ